MPTFARKAAAANPGAESDRPSTMMSPDWMGSRRLMQRIRGLLPLPLGPQTTTTFPAPISRLISLRTWREPNHLFTSRNSITGASYGPFGRIAKHSLAYYMTKGNLQQKIALTDQREFCPLPSLWGARFKLGVIKLRSWPGSFDRI